MGYSENSKVAWLGDEVGLPRPLLLDELLQGCEPLGDVMAFPGLVNSHDHLAFNCYPPTGSPPYRDFLEWSRDVQSDRALIESVEAIPPSTRIQFGLLKNLLWGVTAVADHGGKPAGGPITVLGGSTALHSPEAEAWGRLKLLTRTRPVVAHVGEGITPQSRQRARTFLRWNVRRRTFAGVHAVSFAPSDFTLLDALIWCPESNFFLFGRTADIAAASRHTRILFGTDSTLSAPGTLWDHVRRVRGLLPNRTLLAALTTTAAGFWNLPHVHWQHDFVVARRRHANLWDSFFAQSAEDILLVVSGGEIALADAAVADAVHLPDPVSLAVWNETRKFVRLPLQTMSREIAEAAPGFDQAALFERLIGRSAVARAA